MPVYKDTVDNIVGIINEKDFFYNNDLSSIMLPTVRVLDSMKISKLVSLLREKKQHLAVVTDEYGGTVGVVSLEDALEELVGEIWDEHDKVTVDYRQMDDDTYVVSGGMELDEFFELTGLDEDDADTFESTTVGGWVSEKLEKIPVVGDTFDYNNLTILVQLVADRKVERVLVVRKEEPAAEDAD